MFVGGRQNIPHVESLGVQSSAIRTESVRQAQKHDGAKHGHENAPEIKSCHASGPNEAEQESTEERTDNADNDIANDSLALIVNNFAANEARDEP